MHQEENLSSQGVETERLAALVSGAGASKSVGGTIRWIAACSQPVTRRANVGL